MIDPQYFVMVIGGVAFGGFTWATWHVGARTLTLMLFYLWVFFTLFNQAFRWFEGAEVTDHLATVTSLRLVFGISAVLAVWMLGRWRASVAGDDR